MENEIRQLTEKTECSAVECADMRALNDLKVSVLGKNGALTAILRNIKDLPPDLKPAAGKIVNEAREKLEKIFAERSKFLEEKELKERLVSEKIDITIDKRELKGGFHPLNIVRNKLIDFFVSLGFTVDDSPEIEKNYYNFEALNIPEDHPAREVQDTFFVSRDICLRSQTSSGQIRFMEKTKPPIKMISPGRVYRADDPDATHSPMFHQIEGLVVDKGVTMCDLKGILELFAKQIFGSDTKIRFRPSYFPFTEPSIEVDVTCSHCKGKGCNVCKGTGWIEILGAGMVNRNVLKNCGINPDVYTGFAFGAGLDRMTNIIHGINDARIPFENDIRFLKQFN